MIRNTFTVYRTNKPNLLGGFMTYNSFVDALLSGANHIFLQTFVNHDNNLGITVTGTLCKLMWETQIK